MSMYLDTITITMAVLLLLPYSKWLMKKRTLWPALGVSALTFYLLAQTGWTTAWLAGDHWGRDLSNYIWFAFNTTTCLILYFIWREKDDK